MMWELPKAQCRGAAFSNFLLTQIFLNWDRRHTPSNRCPSSHSPRRRAAVTKSSGDGGSWLPVSLF